MNAAWQHLRRRWPEYLIEAAGLGVFMLAACLGTALLEHPASPVRQALPDAFTRRALMGLAMGATAVAIIYSPWGQRSGAHINPAVTLTFLRLGRLPALDAGAYVLAQVLGGLSGVLVAAWLLGPAITHPRVAYAVTVPGPGGAGLAFVAEALISAGLMLTVLVVSASAHARWTGLCAGLLVALYITFEAPLSGMSINPARTWASALPAGDWRGAWIYASAPFIGMLGAAELFLRLARGHHGACAVLHHDARTCSFCRARVLAHSAA